MKKRFFLLIFLLIILTQKISGIDVIGITGKASSQQINLSINIVRPLELTINSPLAQVYYTNLINFNVTLNREGYCLYTLDSGATNITMNTTDNKTFFNSSNLNNGNYLVRFYCNDSEGHTNYTESINFIILSETPPSGGGGGGAITPTPQPQINETNKTCEPLWECTNWSECKNNKKTRTCVDKNNCGFYEERPAESEFCEEEIPIRTNWICGEWSECKADYTTEDIIKGNLFLKGKKSRTCKDEFGYYPDIIEEKKCDTRIPIITKKYSKCGKDYLDVYDLNNTFVLRIEITKEELTQININLNENETLYCDYCFDGIKNYDEDEIDCNYDEGGSCPLCEKIKDCKIKLIKGLNLISICSNLEDYSIQKVLEKIEGDYDYILEYDYDKKIYKLWKKSGTQQLKEFKKDKSYFIYYTKNETALLFNNSLYNEVIINVPEGLKTPFYPYEIKSNKLRDTEYYGLNYDYILTWDKNKKRFNIYNKRGTQEIWYINSGEGLFIFSEKGIINYTPNRI